MLIDIYELQRNRALTGNTLPLTRIVTRILSPSAMARTN